ncbi:MAG: class I tRNA ligase family protein [bacterium]
MSYDHKEIEKKAQEKWESLNLSLADLSDESKELYYFLVEFPYPSGDLHIGHWYAYAVTDIYARMLRMRGKNVLFPIGFDAFGLPAENAAIKNGKDPKEWTYKNIERMRAQLASMGASFDWSKEVVTCDPGYYRWTQWLFAKLFEHGLAERREAAVKWCPKDQTVLANEQVIDGCCERCGTTVEEKYLTQWFLKITQYAERLLDGLDTLPWREEIKDAQRAWIGKSEGAYLNFEVRTSDVHDANWTSDVQYIKVFTTRPDTIFGATYVVLAPEHPLIDGFRKSITNEDEVGKYVDATKKKTERERNENKEKTGVKLEGVSVINPATKEEIPVFVADFVLDSYGTSAIMSVPAHDERDYAFARKFGIPIVSVIETPPSPISFIVEVDDNDTSAVANEIRLLGIGKEHVTPTFRVYEVRSSKSEEVVAILKQAEIGSATDYEGIFKNKSFILNSDGTISFISVYIGDGKHVNSDFLNGLNNSDAIEKTIDWLEKEKYGARQVIYRIRDWLVSRQRYWGCPIPIVYDPDGKPHVIPAEHLPWLLPTDVDFKPTGKAPLASSKELKERVTRIFGDGWTPEYDTLDTFVDSSWYFLRYLDAQDAQKFSDAALMKKWLPINRYSGGSEHTTMHVLYARFFMKALYDLVLVPVDEPFTERFNRGLIMGPDGQKMSKSKGNVVNPDEFVEKYGADAVRLYLAFIGPYNEPGSYPWNLDGVAAMRKFLERVTRFVVKNRGSKGKEIRRHPLEKHLALTEDKITRDGDRFKFNTCIASLMTFLSMFEKEEVPQDITEKFIIMLAPFAPHITEELWEKLGGDGSVHQQSWPTFDATLLILGMANVTVQVNGKRRGFVSLVPDASEADAISAAHTLHTVVTALGGKEPKRVVYVPGKILNLVV